MKTLSPGLPGALVATIALAALVLAVNTLTACTPGASPDGPLKVWTNDPDAAFFLEQYSAATDRVVHLRFVPNLTAELTQQRVDADLVIGRWINNPPVHAVLQDLAEDRVLHPLAFSLGAVVYNREITEPLPPFSVSLAVLGESVQPLGTLEATADLPPMRIVLSTQEALLYEQLRIAGLKPLPDGAGSTLWDGEIHDTVMSDIRSLQEGWNESAAAERAYTEQYLYEPWFRLLETGRVLAVFRRSDELFSWEFFERRPWDFRWLSREDGSLLVLENVVYAGIPLASRRRTAALHLLGWLDDPGNQIRLMQKKIDHGIDTFGLFGGFSLHDETNEGMARTIRPLLLDRLPAVDTLVFPGPRPRYWDEARQEVVLPYLRSAARSDTLPTGAALGERLHRWYSQRGD